MSEDFSKLTKKQLLDKLNQIKNAPGGVVESSSRDAEIEMDRLNRMSQANNPNQIPFSVNNDHKNVILYTPLNKRIGPLHPDNAKTTMERFRRKGIQLYTKPRTQEEIDVYKQTDFYKQEHEKHLARRAYARRTSKKKDAELYAKEIAKETAVAVAEAIKDGK